MNLYENKSYFQELIQQTADYFNMRLPIIEKDYFVVLLLKRAFENVNGLVFKGGTSLSKCQKNINRFSEDIDLTLDIGHGVKVSELFNAIQDTEKFKQMLVYILSKFEKRGLTKTKLAKLLYLSDFYHYYNHFDSISHVLYKCKEYGPLAEPFLEVVEDMYEKGELHIDVLEEGAQMFTLSKSFSKTSLNRLSDEEKKEIDMVCDKWKNANSKELVNFTHKQKPWMACRENEIIPYDLILQEDPNNVF